MSSVQRKASHKQRGGDDGVRVSGSTAGGGDLRYYALKAVQEIAKSPSIQALKCSEQQAQMIKVYVDSLNVGAFGVREMQRGAAELKAEFIKSGLAKDQNDIMTIFGKIWAVAKSYQEELDGDNPKPASPSPNVEGQPANVIKINFAKHR